MTTTEVITRRDLPHWYVPGAVHFVTYRLYGTLPETKLLEWRTAREVWLKKPPPRGQSRAEYRAAIHKQLFALYDDWLDRATDVYWLADPRVAALVRSSLYFLHGSKYHLLAYCVMPNHVHVLFQPTETTSRGAGVSPAGDGQQARRLHHEEMPVGEEPDKRSPLSSILHSLKSYTAHEANKILKRRGSFWQSESYDHWVRDDDELERIVNYISNNPVKAQRVEWPHEWFYCSAHDRFLTDGERTGWLEYKPATL